jgi:hypothetical protein
MEGMRRAYNVLVGRDDLGDLGVHGATILRWILNTYGVDWIHLAQVRVWWQAIANSLMKLRVP